MIVIGIDPGTTTGVALWSTPVQKFTDIRSGGFIDVYEYLKEKTSSLEEINELFFIRVEDARKRKWFGSKSSAKQQGAGSVKRESGLWQEACEYHDWPYEMIHPIKGATKWSSEKFNKITGWKGRTNENARDAAMLVYKLNTKHRRSL